MKDKRTYTNLKEHGEDMSHENESKIINEPKKDRGALDLAFLIDEHKAEISPYNNTTSSVIFSFRHFL